MKPKDLQEYYKTSYQFNKDTGMAANSFLNWIKWGYIPYAPQKKLEKLTNGALVADWSDSQPKEK